MKLSKAILAIVAIIPLLAGLNGCSKIIIGTHEGADRVSLADANQVASCQSKGGATISIFAKGRYEKDVESDMYQMARNQAADVGADTVVKGESTELGKRVFEFYKCRP